MIPRFSGPAGLTASEIAEWLFTALQGYLLENAGPWLFGNDMASWIGNTSHISDDLVNIYKALDSSALDQANFKAALPKVLCQIPVDLRYAPIYRTVLLLAQKLQATDVLQVLQFSAGAGFLYLVDEQDSACIFLETLETASSLSQPKAASDPINLDVLNDLVTSSGKLASAHAGVALLAYCRADGGHFGDHIVTLRGPMNELIHEYGPPLENLQQLADDIVHLVGLTTVAKALPTLHFGSGLSDSWLLKPLFGGDHPVLRCTTSDETSGLEIQLTGCSAKGHVIEETAESRPLISHLKDLQLVDLALRAPVTKTEEKAADLPEESANELWTEIHDLLNLTPTPSPELG